MQMHILRPCLFLNPRFSLGEPCVGFFVLSKLVACHAKEEKVLFAGFDPEMDIIATMCREHDQARHLVRELVRGIEAAEITLVAACLTAHRELLQAHIKKEDEILYPWIDRGLSDAQVGRLFSRFREVDREFAGEPDRQEEFVRRAEQTLHARAG